MRDRNKLNITTPVIWGLAVLKTDKALFRQGAGLEFGINTSIDVRKNPYQYVVVDLCERKDSLDLWVKVKYNGQYGWISSEQVIFTVPAYFKGW